MIFAQLTEAIKSAQSIEQLKVAGVLALVLVVLIYVWREDLLKRREEDKKRKDIIDIQSKERKDKELEADIKLKIEKEQFEGNLKTQKLEFQKDQRERDRKERELQRQELAQAVKENKMMQERVITMLSDLVTGNTQALQNLTAEINSHKGQNTSIMASVSEEVGKLSELYSMVKNINKGINQITDKIDAKN